jgi:imidazolonepropionase
MSPIPFAITCPRLVTCDPARATPADPLGVIDDAMIIITDGIVTDAGPRAEMEQRWGSVAMRTEAPGLVTPGLVDAHTHAPWVGSRHLEYQARLEGGDYEAIAKAGGGIVSTMRAVREASVETITSALTKRLHRMAALGVTTVECKSGYGLDEAGENKQLEAIRAAAQAPRTPRVVATFLALHALPPEVGADDAARAAYADDVAHGRLSRVAQHGLARFVDAYVDRSAFSIADARRVLVRAKELGFGLRLHAGQFADIGGAQLAAELGALSADHLEHVSDAGLEAMAKANVRAVLLPIASMTLKQAPPPVEAMRRLGVRMVVASDANPGTAPTESLPLALALAVRNYGLTVAEAILGATREAAASLGLQAVGVIRHGMAADLVAWDLPHEAAIVQPWGTSRVAFVHREGQAIA